MTSQNIDKFIVKNDHLSKYPWQESPKPETLVNLTRPFHGHEFDALYRTAIQTKYDNARSSTSRCSTYVTLGGTGV